MPRIPAQAFREMSMRSGWVAKMILDAAQMIFGPVPVLFVRPLADELKQAAGFIEFPHAFQMRSRFEDRVAQLVDGRVAALGSEAS